MLQITGEYFDHIARPAANSIRRGPKACSLESPKSKGVILNGLFQCLKPKLRDFYDFSSNSLHKQNNRLRAIVKFLILLAKLIIHLLLRLLNHQSFLYVPFQFADLIMYEDLVCYFVPPGVDLIVVFKEPTMLFFSLLDAF